MRGLCGLLAELSAHSLQLMQVEAAVWMDRRQLESEGVMESVTVR
jgi:hypothetical protein